MQLDVRSHFFIPENILVFINRYFTSVSKYFLKLWKWIFLIGKHQRAFVSISQVLFSIEEDQGLSYVNYVSIYPASVT